MTFLIETDVLIDVALGREPHVENAALLIDALERRPGWAYIAWHSIANFYYMVRPKRGHDQTKTFLLELSRFIQVAPTTTESLHLASHMEMRDFEDALQAAAAIACRAQIIVTRNIKDYVRSPVKAVTPVRALREYLSG